MLLSMSKDCPSCGSNHKTKPYCIYTNGTHCFSCGHTKTTDRNFIVSTKIQSSDIVKLPDFEDNPANFSTESLRWLYKYHVYEFLIREYRIMEAEGPSLIFPVVKDNVLTMYQRRWITGERRIITGGPKTHMYSHSAKSDTVIIVEDMLSCIRVGELLPTLCLFGTKLKYEEINNIINNYTNIILWLDGDKPGQEAAATIENQLKQEAKKHIRKKAFELRDQIIIKNILTKYDPKVYTKTELRRILDESCNISARGFS